MSHSPLAVRVHERNIWRETWNDVNGALVPKRCPPPPPSYEKSTLRSVSDLKVPTRPRIQRSRSLSDLVKEENKSEEDKK